MAITVDWDAKIINVPKADLTLVQASPTEIRQLDIDVFRLTLKALEAGEEGMAFDDTHSHNPPVTVGGVTLARVVEIINGYTVTFEDGQYAVNLVGANSNIGDVVNVNQVSVRSANSAGLTFSEEIQDQSFLNGRVFVEENSIYSGTNYPVGTVTRPVNNFLDAYGIAGARELFAFQIHGAFSLGSSFDMSNHEFYGTHPDRDMITLTGALTTRTVFENVTVSGALNGDNELLRYCNVGTITGFDGSIISCVLCGDITMSDSVTGTILINDSSSNVAGQLRPTIDMNNVSADLSIRRYSGGLTLKNLTAGNDISVDIVSGTVEFHSSCTSGTVVVRGNATVIDSSGPGFTVIRGAHTQMDHVLSMASGNFTVTDVSSGIKDFAFRDRNGVTLFSIRIEDGVGRTRLSG